MMANYLLSIIYYLRKSRSSGFSLIEITIAVAIIGMMAIATGALMGNLPVNGRETRDQHIALTVARSELETLRAAGYDALPASGPFTDTLLNALVGASAAVAIADYSATTKRTDVTVSWKEAGNTRSLTLTTLITKDSTLP